jgi:hypothetical protein
LKLLENCHAAVALSPIDLQLRRFGFDERRAHALLTLDNDPLRPIRSEDLEQVSTTTAATHLLQTVRVPRSFDMKLILHQEREMIRRDGGRIRCAWPRGRKRFSKFAC